MFDHSFADAGLESRRPWTFTVSLLSQGILLLLLGLASILAGPELPIHDWTAVFLEPPLPPAAAPPPPPEQPAVQVVEPERFQSELTQPAVIPEQVAMIVEEAPPPAVSGPGVVGSTGAPEGADGGVLTGLIADAPQTVAPPPPPPTVEPKPPATAQPIQIGGAVQAAKLLRRVAPAYPPLARQARVQGVVKLSAIIAEDGSIEKLEALSGHPLLIPAALQAVRQWRYRPTLLNGKPVQVATQIDVRFHLN